MTVGYNSLVLEFFIKIVYDDESLSIRKQVLCMF
jgi:hypothetical protein